MNHLPFSLGFIIAFCSFLPGLAQAMNCQAPWKCEAIEFQVSYREFNIPLTTNVRLRTGVYPATGTYVGSILYLEGLGDSMMNHELLFNRLSLAGYEIIAYDYMGQGGSSGSMDHTRIDGIENLGNRVWKHYVTNRGNLTLKTVLGWSTGGLAAYLMAATGDADQVILIAPGIVPNIVVGAGLFHWPPDEITESSLTRDSFQGEIKNPHVDPISPQSPAAVPSFAASLMLTAARARHTLIPPHTRGLVLLSGQDDTYVNATETLEVIKRNAPQFTTTQYPKALHEIDNEVLSIRLKMQEDILNFLQTTP